MSVKTPIWGWGNRGPTGDEARARLSRRFRCGSRVGRLSYPDQVFDNFKAIVGRKPVLWEDLARKHKGTFLKGFQS